MAEKRRFYWLKLQDDFFGSKRIKKLRKIAGGDTYTIIYLKMQLLAMKSGGVLEYTGLEQTFAEELALDLDEDADNVSVTVNYLLACGLLETADNKEYFLPYAVLNTGSEGTSAKRVREHRERKALQCNTDVTDVKQIGNGEIEKEKDTEIDIDKRVDCQQIVDLYHSICKSFATVRSLTDSRKKAIKARLNTYTIEDFKTLFTNAEASAFLKGANDRNWTATFDWLIKDANMAKVLEGNYADKPKRSGRKEIVPSWAKSNADWGVDNGVSEFDKALLQYTPKMPKTAGNDEGIRAKAEALQKQLKG
jgi:predicted phage replisome organizer